VVIVHFDAARCLAAAGPLFTPPHRNRFAPGVPLSPAVTIRCCHCRNRGRRHVDGVARAVIYRTIIIENIVIDEPADPSGASDSR
jgi:hypothetical protein